MACALGLAARPAFAQSPLPHDIRGLVTIRSPWDALAPWLGAGLAAALALALAWYLWRRHRRARPEAAPEDPWDILRRRVEALTPRAPFDRKAQEDFFYELSLLLREAIEGRTSVRATDLTLQELRGPLRQRLPLAGEETEAVIALLERSDLVKFAEREATPAEATAARTRVAQWVRQLQPQPVAALPTELAEATAGRTQAGGRA